MNICSACGRPVGSGLDHYIGPGPLRKGVWLCAIDGVAPRETVGHARRARLWPWRLAGAVITASALLGGYAWWAQL